MAKKKENMMDLIEELTFDMLHGLKDKTIQPEDFMMLKEGISVAGGVMKIKTAIDEAGEAGRSFDGDLDQF